MSTRCDWAVRFISGEAETSFLKELETLKDWDRDVLSQKWEAPFQQYDNHCGLIRAYHGYQLATILNTLIAQGFENEFRALIKIEGEKMIRLGGAKKAKVRIVRWSDFPPDPADEYDEEGNWIGG